MEILKVYTEGNNPFALEVKDGGEQYPIPYEALHNPTILTEILNSGWELRSLPFNFIKGNVTLNDIPTEETTEDMMLERGGQMYMDIMDNVLEHRQLLGYVTDASVTMHFVEKPPVIKLVAQTREEFLQFLNDLYSSRYDELTPEMYLPINSMVASDALFSVEEFFDQKNVHYRTIIEQRRRITLEQYRLLTQALIETGMPEKYNSYELYNSYLQWGLCGVNMHIRDITTVTATSYIGQSEKSQIKENRLAIYTSDMRKIYADGNSDGYSPKLSQVRLGTVVSAAERQAAKHGIVVGKPVGIERPTTQTRVRIEFDGGFLEHNGQVAEMRTSNRYHNDIFTLISVRANLTQQLSVLGTEMMDFLHNDETIKSLYKNMLINSIANDIVQRKTLKSQVSSNAALASANIGSSSQLSYYGAVIGPELLLSDGEDTKSTALEKDLAVMIENLRNYLTGTENLVLTEQESELFQNFLDRTIAADDIRTGLTSDSEIGIDEIANSIRAAVDILGADLASVYESVRSIDFETPFMKLSGPKHPDVYIVVDLPKRDAMHKGASTDIARYIRRAADTATNIHKITHAFRAVSMKPFAEDPTERKYEHIGVRTRTFIMYDNHIRIFESLLHIVKEEIQNNIDYKDQTRYFEEARRLTYDAMFDAADTGWLVIKYRKLDIKVNIGYDLKVLLTQCMMDKFETIWQIIDYNLNNLTLGSQHYIVNATLVDDCVVPHPGEKIKEMSPYLFWYGLSAQSKNRQLYFDKEQIPSVDWVGGEDIYSIAGTQGKARPTSSDTQRGTIVYYNSYEESLSTPRSLTHYMQWVQDWADSQPQGFEPLEVPNYKWYLYPGLYPDKLEEYTELLEEDRKPSTEKVRIIPGKVVEYTRDDVLNVRKDLNHIFRPIVEDPSELDSFNKLMVFKGLTAEEMYVMNDQRTVVTVAMITAPIKFDVEPGANVASTIVDGQYKTLTPEQIVNLNPEIYAIREIYRNCFLLKTFTGRTYKIRVH